MHERMGYRLFPRQKGLDNEEGDPSCSSGAQGEAQLNSVLIQIINTRPSHR